MRKQLSKSEIQVLNSEIRGLYGLDNFFHKKDSVFLFDTDFRIIFSDKPLFFYYGDKLVPTLKLLLDSNFLKSVVVDMGAVRFVTNGADIMRPGITSFDDSIDKDDFVVVVDETYKKPLAVCIALFSSEELSNIGSGKVLKNIHYVGDALWNH